MKIWLHQMVTSKDLGKVQLLLGFWSRVWMIMMMKWTSLFPPKNTRFGTSPMLSFTHLVLKEITLRKILVQCKTSTSQLVTTISPQKSYPSKTTLLSSPSKSQVHLTTNLTGLFTPMKKPMLMELVPTLLLMSTLPMKTTRDQWPTLAQVKTPYHHWLSHFMFTPGHPVIRYSPLSLVGTLPLPSWTMQSCLILLLLKHSMELIVLKLIWASPTGTRINPSLQAKHWYGPLSLS